MAPKTIKKALKDTLEDLSKQDFDKFCRQLTDRRQEPRVRRNKVEGKNFLDIVDVLVSTFTESGALQVTVEILKDIDCNEAAKRLVEDLGAQSSKPGSSDRSLRCLKPEDCGSLAVSSGWTKLEPEVSYTDADEAQTYSLKSEAGHFECSVSGLRWFCKAKVSFKYQFCSRDKPMERMERMQYMFAGPLIDITVITGKLDEVYLPFWICVYDSSGISDKFAILHTNDSGDDVEKVSEVTTSHVKLTEAVSSAKAVLIKVGIPLKINCDVLIYFKTNTAFLTLHVYLIPHDPGKQQEIDKENLSYGYKIIRKPHPETSLKLRNRFILNSDFKDAQVSPENLKLQNKSGAPSFFEVYIKNPDKDFRLNLKPNDEAEPVWTAVIRRGDYQSTGATQGEHFVDKHRCDLIERVSNIGPILDNLLSSGVIEHRVYEAIRAVPTSQEKTRALYRGPLKAGGLEAKDTFYKILEEKESFLVKDLKKMDT